MRNINCTQIKFINAQTGFERATRESRVARLAIYYITLRVTVIILKYKVYVHIGKINIKLVDTLTNQNSRVLPKYCPK